MRKFDAFKTFLLLEGVQSFLFGLIFTASAIYQVTEVGLSAFQLVLVGTLLETICFLFEIPTGIVADLYSRRLSIIIGVVLIGIGFFIEGFFPLFATVLLAQFFWGLGATFTSGATQAWIADEVGEARANVAFMRGSQVGRIGGILGVLTSIGVGSAFGIATPVWLGGALMVLLGIGLMLIMPETGFKPTPREERTTWGKMFATFREGAGLVRARPVLLALIGIELFTGLFSEGYDRMSTAHVIRNFGFPTVWGRSFEPVVWFGALGILGDLLGAGVTAWVERKLDLNSDNAVRRGLIGITIGLIVSLLVFAFAPTFLIVVLAMIAVNITRGLTHPLRAAWTNRQISSEDSGVRATIFSMFGQTNAIGQIAGGPGVGWIGNWSMRVGLAVSALLLAPALPLYAQTSGKEKATEYTAAKVRM